MRKWKSYGRLNYEVKSEKLFEDERENLWSKLDQNAQSKRRRGQECRSLGVDQRGHLVEASERKLKLELCMQD